LRLKDNFTLWHEGEETSLAKLAEHKEQRFLQNVAITRKACRTNIGIVCEKGHKEPWIIAMSATPDYYKTMDYGMRWGIECMFSDLKSRGFSLENTQLRYADRIERLVLIMALALYWATS
jgi:Transposase DDE domain